MKHKVYMNYVHPSHMLQHLAELWRNEILCDAILTVNNVVMGKAHKPVLLAASKKMKVLYANSGHNLNSDIMLPDGVSQKSVTACLQYLYEGFLAITDMNVGELMMIARHLEIDSIIDCCENFMLKVIGGHETENEQLKHYRFTETVDVSEKRMEPPSLKHHKELQNAFKKPPVSETNHQQYNIERPSHNPPNGQGNENRLPVKKSFSQTIKTEPGQNPNPMPLFFFEHLHSPMAPVASHSSAKVPIIAGDSNHRSRMNSGPPTIVKQENLDSDLSVTGNRHSHESSYPLVLEEGGDESNYLKDEVIFEDSGDEGDSRGASFEGMDLSKYNESPDFHKKATRSPLMLSKSYHRQFSAEDMLTNKCNMNRSSNAQLFFRMLIKEALKRFGLWERPPCMKDIPPETFNELFEYIFNYAPQLKMCQERVFSKIKKAMQNRRSRSHSTTCSIASNSTYSTEATF